MAFTNSNKEGVFSLRDLSDYYIIKKLSTGWLVGLKQNHETRFIENPELVQMGYLKEEDLRKIPPSNISRPTGPILVPTGEKRRFDLNWRKH